MSGRDIGEIEWRILAQQDDIELREIDALGRAELEMVSFHVADMQRPHGRKHLVAA